MIFFGGALYASDFGMSSADVLTPAPSEKKLRNKIFSTVQSNPSYTPHIASEPSDTIDSSENMQLAGLEQEMGAKQLPSSRLRDPVTAESQDATPSSPSMLDSRREALGTQAVQEIAKEPTASEIDQADQDNPFAAREAPKERSFESLPQVNSSSPDRSIENRESLGRDIPVGQDLVLTDLTKLESNGTVDTSDKEKNVLYQSPAFVDDHSTVAFNFEETDLANVAAYMENIHNIKFISEDILSPSKDAKGLSGHKITFRTNKILSKKESWDLFLTFLHIAGLDVIPMAQAGFYKIVPFAKANSDAIPSYIGVNSELLPDNDMIVRYVYFARNVDPANVQKVISKMQGGSAKLDVFSELKALIFTDRSRNIKSLMQIVHELDQSVMPESLSVIKLKKANVNDVINLYKSLKSSPGQGGRQTQPVWSGKKEASLEYFPQDVATFGDTRTNSLILLGSLKGIKRIEEFIEKYVDIDVDQDTPPVFTYQLQYTKVSAIQPILSAIVKYGPSASPSTGGAGGASAVPAGGVRDGVQYFQNMTIVPEPHSNKLIINSTKEDFEALRPLIEELDIPQKQVGLEVLIVQVSNSDVKTLGSQISAPGGANSPNTETTPCQTFARSISAQTAALTNSVVVTQNATTNENSIKSSLSKLLGVSSVTEAGSLLLTFGQPIWAIFKVLKSITSTHVVANPFVVVSNNSAANVTIGEERRVRSSVTTSGNTELTRGLTPTQAALGFTITPQVNKGNIVNMSIKVENNQFTTSASVDENNATQSKKIVETTASVANGEVLVLGGLMTETQTMASRGVPFLEHIPVLGWLFKSKEKRVQKDHFLIFISPRLLDPVNDKTAVDKYTKYKMEEADENMKLIDEFDWFTAKKDPIQRAFFGSDATRGVKELSSVKFRKKEKKKAKKQKTKKVKKAKNKNDQSEISLDQDFLDLNNSSTYVKNSIFNSARPRKKYG